MLKARYIMGIEQSKKTLDKVIQDIAKREAMIEKTTDKINTTREKLITAEVWDTETDRHIGDIWQYDEKTRDLIWKLEDWIYNNEESKKKLKELEEKRARAEAHYQQDLLPILKELKDEIFNKFYGWEMAVWNDIKDARARDKEAYEAECDRVGRFNAKYDRKNLEAMFKKYGEKRVRDLMYQTEDDIIKTCNRYADGYVMNLIDRVTKYVGQITDYSNLFLTGPSINGIIVGERGRVRLETILAGGWNIQCLHNRVLVKPI